MDRFLPYSDELAILIQSRSADLYQMLHDLNVDDLGLPGHCLDYFKASHYQRLFFSIETSAHLLYRSIKMVNKAHGEVTIMDYGAGVGTLYMLAKMIGCKQVVYSDHLDDWRLSAQLIAKAIGVKIDHYIVGGITDCLNRLDEHQLQIDIIASRNVIEHIYKLDEFYKAIAERQPDAIVFSSTTANKQNPASVIKHRLWHRKWEKVYKGKRSAIIEMNAPELSAIQKKQLSSDTQGLAENELLNAIEQFDKYGKRPDPRIHGSNTCDPSNGVWAEHLLGMEEYRNLIDEKLFNVSFEPGFWDTHYNKSYKNKLGKIFNRIISKKEYLSMTIAPFIYVIAKPR